MKPLYYLLPLSLLLSACQTQIEAQKYGNYIPITELANVELKQRLEIKPEMARVYIQHGKVAGGRDEYDVFCSFEIDKLSLETQYIEPGIFHVRRMQNGFSEIVQAFPIKVASNRLLAGMDYSPPMITQFYHFYLDSDQPNLMRMTCYGAFDMPADARSPSLEEINQALGNIARLSP